MSDSILAPLLTGIGFIGGLGLGILLTNSTNNDALEACAKQHNVYRCEIVAVPMEVVDDKI